MLAFARKQPLRGARRSTSTRSVARAWPMLRRTLGEHIARRDGARREDLWPALADPSQLEDAILNLAVNARDAMPERRPAA